jgi:hypothetical protein
MSLNRSAVLAACASVAVFVALAGCGKRPEKPQLEYTYQKPGMTQQQLLEDERVLRQTSGVVKVFTKIDDHGHAVVELFVDERNKVPGLERAQELGYQQIHN